MKSIQKQNSIMQTTK